MKNWKVRKNIKHGYQKTECFYYEALRKLL